MVGRATVTIELSNRTINKPKQATSRVITWLVRRVVLIMCSNLLRVYEGGPGSMEKSLRAHGCSQLWPMKPFRKCHTSGLALSFMHCSSQLLLLLAQP